MNSFQNDIFLGWFQAGTILIIGRLVTNAWAKCNNKGKDYEGNMMLF